MKIVYVNGKNAKKFDKQVDNNITFAKYFSPSCPACIGMKDEWDNMCKDIDQKYDTDLILAEIDPDGMEGLENTHTYNDVDYVPHIVILENGKKIKEYNGPKTKDKMIEFLLQGGYLKSKMTGGKKSKKTKAKKSKKTKKTKANRKRVSLGAGNFSDDFSFVENKNWLKPFLVQLIQQSSQNTNITWGEATMFAIRRADLVLRPTISSSIVNLNESGSYIDNWYDCPNRKSASDDCRLSVGFGNKWVPNVRKFNPKYNDPKHKQVLKLARDSYNFLEYHQKIKELIDTPSSDYTRFSEDKEDNAFIVKLRTNADLQTNPLKAILDTYGYTPSVSLEEVRGTMNMTNELIEKTHREIEDRLSGDPNGNPSGLRARGGRKTRRRKHSKPRRRRTRK